MNKKAISCLLVATTVLWLVGCKHEKKTEDIITTMAPKPKLSKGPIALHAYTYTKKVEWLGSTYTITITRKADQSQEMVKDDEGRKYYDNKIFLKILRKDGSEFYSRTFTKADFKQFFHLEYAKNGALLGFMFDKVENDVLHFGASVGSPNPTSDEFVPVDITLDKLSHISMKEAEELDSGSDRQLPNVQGKSVIEYENDGV